jgi:predicted DNA-binding protein (MmcQ/YjbR family)
MPTLKPLTRIRRLCLALPAAHEVEAWGEPTFRVKNKLFAMFASASNHHGGGRDSVWIKASAENQALLVAARPKRFFRPPYVGPSGWVGVWLDGEPDWAEVGDLLADGHAMVVPKSRGRGQVR